MPQSEYWPLAKVKAENVQGCGESSLLQKQLGAMEGEVKEIQMELAAIKRDRLDLRNTKRQPIYEGPDNVIEDTVYINTVQDNDFVKYAEMSKLREDLIRAKNAADEERFKRQKYESKLKDLELKLNNICTTALVTSKKEKEPRKIADDEISCLKTQIRDAKDEIEEMSITLSEKTEQLQDYRLKYLQAQQQVEELKRQLDLYEFDNKQVSDQIQIEIQKMKMQFQEKLQELAPLPDLLKGSQMQLQEAKQMQRLAEDSTQQLSSELNRVKEKLVMAVNNFNQEKAEKYKILEENTAMRLSIDEKQKEICDLTRQVDELKCNVLRLEEKLLQEESMYGEKSQECAKLQKEIEEVKDENNRSITRSKERSESMRRYMQTQISELERQLVQSRAQTRASQKERDEIRQRMQVQINNLHESFELVEIRLRALQSQVTSLKNSYTVILSEEDEVSELNRITT
ncbi:PREDICTED: outer dense fiber protein 2-like isoform X1 [Papilio polytes]|uniref:outer dense fiber protein 2-like isoform X1 n=1 Tax=Papilio polytes TaxID=76194 RepID=UPI0006767C53|nr:PREDICTED: outer dense fiber protein 2-like isoform X1 [Papilio polytes]